MTTANEATQIRAADRQETAFLFDLDGTLVDSVYQHVLAWREALEAEGGWKNWNEPAPTASTRILPIS